MENGDGRPYTLPITQEREIQELEAGPTFTLTEKVLGCVAILALFGAASHLFFHWPR